MTIKKWGVMTQSVEKIIWSPGVRLVNLVNCVII